MKGIIEFNLPEDREDFQLAQNGWKYKNQIEEIWEKVFRPYRKHGYSNDYLNKIIDQNPEIAGIIIESLIDIYHEVINED